MLLEMRIVLEGIVSDKIVSVSINEKIMMKTVKNILIAKRPGTF